METEELKAIKKIAEQVENFNKMLGGKVDKAEIDDLRKAMDDIKAIVNDLNYGSQPPADTAKLEQDLERIMKEVNGKMEKFGVQIGEMQRDVDNTKRGGNGKRSTRKDFTAEIKKFVEETFVDGEKTSKKASIRIKAAEIFAIPSFFEGAADTIADAFTGRYIDPTLYQRRRKTNLILDWFTIETINVPKLLFLVKEEVSGDEGSSDDTGGAEWITSGAEKPLRSFRVTTGEAEAKKVAIFGTVEDKLLRDVTSIENWLREDFTAEMKEAYNDALLNNNPSIDPNAPLGLKHNAVQYIGSPAFDGTILDPNEIDCIVAMAADMALRKEQAATAFISKDVWYKIQVLKDQEARYQNNPLVYTNKLGQLYIAGVEVVGVDNEDVPSTHILMIGAEVGFKIKNYSDLVFERGLNADDFRHDRTSYRGYQEVLSYLPTHRENSVMYDTILNILADLQATS